jgi:hypothetical protein
MSHLPRAWLRRRGSTSITTMASARTTRTTTTATTTTATTEMVSIASRHIMRVCLLTTRLREALLPTDLSVPLTHPPIHLPAYLPGDDISSPCDAMAPCTTDSGDDHCTASNNPFRGYECSGSTDSCTFNVVSYEEDDDIYFRMNHSSTNHSSTCNDLCAHFNSTCLGAREGADNLCAGLDAGVTSYTCTDPISAYSQVGTYSAHAVRLHGRRVSTNGSHA